MKFMRMIALAINRAISPPLPITYDTTKDDKLRIEIEKYMKESLGAFADSSSKVGKTHTSRPLHKMRSEKDIEYGG